MNQPTTDPGATGAALPPAGSVFSPQPAAAPPPAAAAPSEATAPVKSPESAPSMAEAYALLSHGHVVLGHIDILEKRLSELLAGHASLVAHIMDQAPAASASAPGGTAFWGQVLDRHHGIHGLLKAAQIAAEKLLAEHTSLLGTLDSFVESSFL